MNKNKLASIHGFEEQGPNDFLAIPPDNFLLEFSAYIDINLGVVTGKVLYLQWSLTLICDYVIRRLLLMIFLHFCFFCSFSFS